MKTGLLLPPKRFAVHDGPGIRTTFFFKGCPLHCLWCHNPESIAPGPQTGLFIHKCLDCRECMTFCPAAAHSFPAGKHVFDKDRCTVCGNCLDQCPGQALTPYGRRWTVQEVMETALEDQNFYETSGGGITLSGGEPLLQPVFALAILQEAKRHGLHTALDTCGFVPRSVLEKALPVTDLFLVDFKHADEEIHRRLTGQSNRIIRKNLQFLSDSGANIEVRIPFVPGCNTDDENMHDTGRFLGGLHIRTVRILPYHDMARSKYAALELADTMPEVPPPSAEEIHHACRILQQYGLEAKSGKE